MMRPFAIVLMTWLAACGGDATSAGAPAGGSADAAADSSVATPDADDAGGEPSDAAAPTDTGGSKELPEWFGEACSANEQCKDGGDEGWCVPFDQDGNKKCTVSCISECPTGFACVTIQNPGGSDALLVCMPELSTSCKPCVEDKDCIYEGSKCIDIGLVGGAPDRRCARDCQRAGCEDGFECVSIDAPAGAGALQLCRPTTGSCVCFGKDDAGSDVNGSIRPCKVSNETGTCQGEETCDGEKGWTGCSAQVPSTETCDGLDNDCDAQTDEGLAATTCTKANDAGECTGNEVCQGKDGWICNAPEPAEEVCDGVDNDCDAAVDDGLLDSDGNGTCDLIDEDDDGDGVADGQDNCPLASNVEQTNTDQDALGDACDDDDDGDGVADEQDNCPLAVNPGQSDLDGDGVGTTCDPDKDGDGVACTDALDCADCDDLNALVGPQFEELCDGLDNSCNSQVDEGFVDTDADALADCVDADDDNDGDLDDADCKPLDPAFSTSSVEACDALDNDCDGAVDEGCPATSVTLTPTNLFLRGGIGGGATIRMGMGTPGLATGGKKPAEGAGVAPLWGFYNELR